jgi:hypothetical protein
MKQGLKERRFVNVAEVPRKSLAALDSIYKYAEEFRKRFQRW